MKNHIRLAVVLQNLRVASPKWNFQEEIPFTIAAGAGLKYGFSAKNIHLLDIASEVFIVNIFYFDDLSVNNSTFNTGVEAVLFRTIAGRFGFQINKYAIKKFSITAGYGICLFNHFEFHFYMNQRNGFDIIPDAGGSINFTRMLKWEKADLRWIREKEE